MLAHAILLGAAMNLGIELEREAGTAAGAAALIDLARYPIADQTGPAGAALLTGCRAQLAETGVALLPGFLTAAATAAMAAEARALAPDAYFCDSTHNAYLEPDDGAFPPDHPRRRRLHTAVGSVAYDRLPAQSPLRRLYNWDPLVAFIGAVLGMPRLYRFADPLGALSINVFKPGGNHAWHFDETEYTTTIMLQEAEEGGFFDFVPHLRRPDGSETETVRGLLDGDERQVRRLPFTPGALSIFAGRVSLHRVSEIAGSGLRLVAVLAFNGRPDATNSDAVRQLFWGRTH
jgi:hypothetical protein